MINRIEGSNRKIRRCVAWLSAPAQAAPC